MTPDKKGERQAGQCAAVALKLTRMEISHFDDLLAAARSQPGPDRLLLVFATASLPADATAEQRAQFETGESGELTPVMFVDQDPAVLTGFSALAREAAERAPDWVLVFASALPAIRGRPPADREVDAALQRMVEAVKSGQLAGMIPFNRQGEAVQLD